LCSEACHSRLFKPRSRNLQIPAYGTETDRVWQIRDIRLRVAISKSRLTGLKRGWTVQINPDVGRNLQIPAYGTETSR
jgi:hypothetical protein